MKSIQERFASFCEDHPDVYAHFRRIAHELRAAGHEHYSAHGILHVIRWHFATSGPGADGLKLNDNFSSRYSRRLIAEDPTFASFFRTRKLRAT